MKYVDFRNDIFIGNRERVALSVHVKIFSVYAVLTNLLNIKVKSNRKIIDHAACNWSAVQYAVIF